MTETAAPKSFIDPSHSELLSDWYTRYCLPGFGKQMHAFGLDLVYHRANGNSLWYNDAQGNECEVIDLVGGYGVNLFGHNPEEFVHLASSLVQSEFPNMVQASVRAGAAELGHILSSVAAGRFGEEYCTALFNTGSDAVEAAIKHCRLIRRSAIEDRLERILLQTAQAVRGQDRRLVTVDTRFFPGFPGTSFDSITTFVQALDSFNRSVLAGPMILLALRGAYHGMTPGALSLTDSPSYRMPFSDLTLPARFIEPDSRALALTLASLQRRIARVELRQGNWILIPEAVSGALGLFIEPLQGEGGVRETLHSEISAMVGLCRRNAVPIVADEVQTGMGRTGRFFAWEHTGAPAPDLIILGKALGAGLAKVSAVMSRAAITEEDFGILHASTFAEDEYGSRIALAVVQKLTGDNSSVLARIDDQGNLWRKALDELVAEYSDVLVEVRGRGLMLGLVFRSLEDSGSNLLRFICSQGDFGYFIAGFLLHEFGVRMAPTLSHPLVMRVQPSLESGAEERRRVVAALRRLCETLRQRDTGALSRFLIETNPEEPLRINDFRSNPRDRVQAGVLAPERVAFLGHFIDPSFLGRHEPALNRFSPDQLERLIRRTWDSIKPCAFVQRDVRSLAGQVVGFHFVGLSITSEILLEFLRRRDLSRVRHLVRESVEVARNHGCKLVGFGQFTSIVTRNCQELIVPGVGFTSGNALTVGMALQALREALQQRGRSLADSRVAIIGAGGNIGSTFARLLADEAGSLTLIGGTGQDSKTRIEKTAGAILLDQSRQLRMGLPIGAAGEQLRARIPPSRLPGRNLMADANVDVDPVQIWREFQASFSDSRALQLGTIEDCKEAEVIVTATNTSRPVLFSEHVSPGTIICDISIPSAVRDDVRFRRDVEIFKGGVVALPHGENLNIGALPLEPGLVYACMAETILLGLERRWEDYSVGDISKSQVLEMLTIAERNGFRLARIKGESSL